MAPPRRRAVGWYFEKKAWQGFAKGVKPTVSSHIDMKTFATIFVLSTLFFIKSLAADAVSMSPSAIELVLNCGIHYESSHSFYSMVEFSSPNIALEVTFRNVGDKSVFPHTLIPNLSFVWDGKVYKYKQPKLNSVWSEIALEPRSSTTDYYSLSDFDIPSEVLTRGRHTLAVNDVFSESETFTHYGSARILFSESNQLISAETSALTIFIKTPK